MIRCYTPNRPNPNACAYTRQSSPIREQHTIPRLHGWCAEVVERLGRRAEGRVRVTGIDVVEVEGWEFGHGMRQET